MFPEDIFFSELVETARGTLDRLGFSSALDAHGTQNRHLFEVPMDSLKYCHDIVNESVLANVARPG